MRWAYLTLEEQQKRLASWTHLSKSFPNNPHWRLRGTDAGIALFDYATTDEDRYSDVAREICDAREAVDGSGRWEDSYEWRIGTDGTDRIERIEHGFRATSEMNGRFRVDIATFADAWEAVHVLSGLGKSLFYALSWTSNPTTPGLEPEADRPMGEAYLKRLAGDAATHVPAKGGSIVTAPPPPPSEWEDPVELLYVVTVRRKSLVLECECTTQERADLFLRVFDRLADDLLEILGWKPLPATR